MVPGFYRNCAGSRPPTAKRGGTVSRFEKIVKFDRVGIILNGQVRAMQFEGFS